MQNDEEELRLKILNQLRNFEIRQADEPALAKMRPVIGKMAEAIGADFGTVERICKELEEENLIKYTSKKTLSWGLEQRKRRSIAIVAGGRSYLKDQDDEKLQYIQSIHTGDINIYLASDGSQISTGENSNQTIQNTTVSGSTNVAVGEGNAQASSYSETDSNESKSSNVLWGVVASLIAAAIIALITWIAKS
jgi:DNA-binding transcriptional regulator YhcF (GntR family)